MIPLFKVYMSERSMKFVDSVLRSGYIGEGQYVAMFETELRHLTGSDREIITLNSATSGLQLACHMIDIKPGDEVITTPITCTATQAGIVHRGATLVWGDVDYDTGLLSPEDVAKRITRKTKAIIATNWAGAKPNYNALKQFGIPVIEDAAHGPYVLDGNNGDYVVWSTQAIKFLTTGDGGFMYCPDPDRARLLRWYGLDRRSSADFRCEQNVQEFGYKYHMNDIAAAIGLGNMGALSDILAAHKHNAEQYALHLLNRTSQHYYIPDSAYWLFTLRTKNAKHMIDYLKLNNIHASPVHAANYRHDALQHIAKRRYNTDEDVYRDLPNAYLFDKSQLNIPVGWWLTNNDRQYIMDVVNFYKGEERV